ncbi:Ger(x)C family spore germination protein [Halanaerobaculum tunisiense]
MKKKIVLILMILLLLPTLVGCWDNQDLTDMSIVIAVGLDQIKEDKIEVTVQLVKANTIAARQQGSQEKAFWTYSATGDTVFSAVRNLNNIINRKPFWSHLQLIVVGEELAQEGMMKVLDFFERDHELTPKAKIMISKNIAAKKVLEAESDLESLPALHLSDVLTNQASLAKMMHINLVELLNNLKSFGFSPAIGMVEVGQEIKNKKQINVKDLKVHGAAVFKRDKLIGWLDPILTRGLLFVQNKIKSGIINVSNPLDEDQEVAMEISQSTSKINVKLKQSKPVFEVEVKAEGKLAEQQGRGNLTNSEMINKLEQKGEEVIKKNIRQVIKLGQKKYNSDFFGFSQIVHREYVDYWHSIKEDWNSIFSQAPIKIKVTWKIRHSGLIKQRVEPK